MADTKCPRCGQTLQRHCTYGCGACSSGMICPTHGKDWPYRVGGGLFSSGRTGSGAKCRKHGVAVVNCPWCKGVSGKTCSTCGGTGQTCPQCGRYWT